MKTLASLVLAAAISLLAGSPAFAKQSKVSLSDFSGNYRGKVSLEMSYIPGITLTGPARVVFKAIKSGQTGSIHLTGSPSAMGTTLPTDGTFTLNRGNFSVDTIILEQGDLPSAQGFYILGRKTIQFMSANSVDNIHVVSANLKIATKGHKQTLVFKHVGYIGLGVTFTYTFEVSRRVK